MTDFDALQRLVCARRTFESELHGPVHWRQVEANGLRLAAATRADPVVVRLFALFHDSRRKNDGADPAHGRRGAEFARECYDAGLLGITPEQFARLHHACCFHTSETRSRDATVNTCYDADRLDLGRVGMRPDPRKMATFAGAALARAARAADIPPSGMRDWLGKHP